MTMRFVQPGHSALGGGAPVVQPRRVGRRAPWQALKVVVMLMHGRAWCGRA